MTAFAHLPLGQRIPASIHGVSCSLPTMRSVIGYEEKDPAITQHLTSGYPRFVVHPYVRRLAAEFSRELDLAGQTLWLTSSAHMAAELATYLGEAHVTRVNHDGLHGIAHPEAPELFARAKTYLQHTGGFLGSREAEDHLVRRGLLAAAEAETVYAGDALGAVYAVLRRAYPSASDADFVLTNTGMGAFHAAWRTLADLQASRGRTVWVQLGWLYLDTIALLKKFAGGPDDYVYLRDVGDLGAIERLFSARGDRIAGIVTEVPTNPLVQTPDVAAIAALAHRHGARVILDPTLVSPLNVDVLAHADVIVNSLTKYSASEGDVIAGVAVINPAGPDAAWLRTRVARRAEPIYRRDLARLAAQIGDYEDVIARINVSAPRVIEFLRSHPRVRDVFWTGRAETAAHYAKISRGSEHIGGMVSFTVHGPLADFYDKLGLPKGPSFGMKTTLICPFIYLAHYDLVTSEAGRAELAASGIDPDLLRLSIGCEPADEIIAALADALG
ncbi:MAG TPA: PLP-dependent transferase [Opitutaceae bacterium]